MLLEGRNSKTLTSEFPVGTCGRNRLDTPQESLGLTEELSLRSSSSCFSLEVTGFDGAFSASDAGIVVSSWLGLFDTSSAHCS